MPDWATPLANSSNVMVGIRINWSAEPSTLRRFDGDGSMSNLMQAACAHINAASNKCISRQFNVSRANIDSNVFLSMSTKPSDLIAISACGEVEKQNDKEN